ncbi:MAG: energy transducer TonB [Acidobacteriota bacterium]
MAIVGAATLVVAVALVMFHQWVQTDGRPGLRGFPEPSLRQDVVQEGMIVPLASCDTKPRIQTTCAATYPSHALGTDAGGTVVVSVLVSETGEVIDAKVSKPSGSKYSFDEAALDAARKYTFDPAVKDGRRVKVWIDLPVFDFRPPR